MGIIMAQVAVLQMNMESRVVITMKAASRLRLPVPANISTLRASLLWRLTCLCKIKQLWFKSLMYYTLYLSCGRHPHRCQKKHVGTGEVFPEVDCVSLSEAPPIPHLATEPVSMTPRRGSATTGTREETSSGSASVVQSTATSTITQPVRSFCEIS